MLTTGENLIGQFPEILQIIQEPICNVIDQNFFSLSVTLPYMFVLLQINEGSLKAQ